MSKDDLSGVFISPDVRDWLCAVAAFDYGDRKPLADLMRKGDPMPEPFRDAIADIVAGTRKPKLKVSVHTKIKPALRLKVAFIVYDGLSMGAGFKANAAEHGDRSGEEPKEVVAFVEKEIRMFKSEIASACGVSTYTVDAVTRDLRARIRRYPIV